MREGAPSGRSPSVAAAYERISSSARGSGERRPRIMAIVTGKNVRYVAMIDDRGRRSARRRTRSSARAPRSGSSGWRSTYGTNARSSSREWTKSVASTEPEQRADERSRWRPRARCRTRPRPGTGPSDCSALRCTGAASAARMLNQWGRFRSVANGKRNGGVVVDGEARCPGRPRTATGTPPSHLTASQRSEHARSRTRPASPIRRRREWAPSPASASTRRLGRGRRGRDVDRDAGRHRLAGHRLVGDVEGAIDDLEALGAAAPR